MTRLEWAREYHTIIKTTLINEKYYHDVKEANRGVRFHDDLDDRGPAITYDGDYEILGTEILLHTTLGSKFITLPEMDSDFFAEPENSECVRIYEA